MSTPIFVNTGRAASRSIYLNLRAQKNLLVPSRYSLDETVSTFIHNDDDRGLIELGKECSQVAGLSAGKQLALVFHGVRPRLDFPFDSSVRNQDLLRIFRDQFGVDQVILLVREPLEVFRSEMNRRMAGQIGDWSFGELGWPRHPVTLKELGSLAEPEVDHLEKLRPKLDVDLLELAREVSIRTGKTASLHRLFASVFDDVVVLPYNELLENPNQAYEFIDKCLQVPFDNDSLVATRLNGLVNRFLVYNPLLLELESKGRWYKPLASKEKDVVSLRLELRDVIGLCEDWGSLSRLRGASSDQLREVSDSAGSPVALSIRKRDLQDQSAGVKNRILDPITAGEVAQSMAPWFAKAIPIMERFYRDDAYRECWPPEIEEIFISNNYREIMETREMIGR